MGSRSSERARRWRRCGRNAPLRLLFRRVRRGNAPRQRAVKCARSWQMRESGPDAAHVWKLMQDLGTCMLASLEHGVIRARPMTPRPRESENAVYFLTSARGDKDEEIEADDSVSLMFMDGA